MKKGNSLLVVLLCLTFLGKAQNFTLKGGLNLSTLFGDYPEWPDSDGIDVKHSTPINLGVNFGGTFSTKINREFDFETGIAYSVIGGTSKYHLKDETDEASFSQKLKLGYLQMPLLIKFKLSKKLSIDGGFQFSYLVHAKGILKLKDYNNSSNNEETSYNALEDGEITFEGSTVKYLARLNRFDLGLIAGITYRLSKTLYIQPQFNFGLIIVDDNSTNGNETESFKMRNGALQISMGYQF